MVCICVSFSLFIIKFFKILILLRFVVKFVLNLVIFLIFRFSYIFYMRLFELILGLLVLFGGNCILLIVINWKVILWYKYEVNLVNSR